MLVFRDSCSFCGRQNTMLSSCRRDATRPCTARAITNILTNCGRSARFKPMQRALLTHGFDMLRDLKAVRSSSAPVMQSTTHEASIRVSFPPLSLERFCTEPRVIVSNLYCFLFVFPWPAATVAEKSRCVTFRSYDDRNVAHNSGNSFTPNCYGLSSGFVARCNKLRIQIPDSNTDMEGRSRMPNYYMPQRSEAYYVEAEQFRKDVHSPLRECWTTFLPNFCYPATYPKQSNHVDYGWYNTSPLEQTFLTSFDPVYGPGQNPGREMLDYEWGVNATTDEHSLAQATYSHDTPLPNPADTGWSNSGYPTVSAPPFPYTYDLIAAAPFLNSVYQESRRGEEQHYRAPPAQDPPIMTAFENLTITAQTHEHIGHGEEHRYGPPPIPPAHTRPEAPQSQLMVESGSHNSTFEAQANIEFWVNGRKGMSLADAGQDNPLALTGANDLVFEELRAKVSYRLMHRRFGEFKRQKYSRVKACRKGDWQSVTRAKVAKQIKEVVCAFVEYHTHMKATGVESLVLLEVRQVSKGSWQPLWPRATRRSLPIEANEMKINKQDDEGDKGSAYRIPGVCSRYTMPISSFLDVSMHEST
ncbi:hypothetical protein NM688_g6965 [Phlebia brevispora]|uniref:Uncharacterized protein n=1 Tax=Phlebia brevispora TaxID=194682 RepID=A0ACC1SAS8_9APHY|nr:hypothetical protein NM688_g6965 [Phlebia brevispora]